MIQFDAMNWKRMLAYVTGSVDEELLARNEYLVTENRILRGQIKGRIRLTDPERISLASAAKRLGRKALEEVAQSVRPETILAFETEVRPAHFANLWKFASRVFPDRTALAGVQGIPAKMTEIKLVRVETVKKINPWTWS